MSEGTRVVITVGVTSPEARECILVDGLFQHVLHTSWRIRPTDCRITKIKIIG